MPTVRSDFFGTGLPVMFRTTVVLPASARPTSTIFSLLEVPSPKRSMSFHHAIAWSKPSAKTVCGGREIGLSANPREAKSMCCVLRAWRSSKGISEWLYKRWLKRGESRPEKRLLIVCLSRAFATAHSHIYNERSARRPTLSMLWNTTERKKVSSCKQSSYSP